jgi:protein-disulfide isomerase
VRRSILLAPILALGLAACGGSGGTFESRLAATAGRVPGLDVAAWQACRSDPAKAARVDADIADGDRVGVTGTPTFLVNGTLLVGSRPASTFRTAIDAALAEARSSGLPASQVYASIFPAVPVGTSPVIGPADAWVTIVEFSDFGCPHCAAVQPVLDTLLLEYGSDVRLVFKNYPFLGADSRTAAVAAECAGAQGLFWGFHDLVFADQSQLFGG